MSEAGTDAWAGLTMPGTSWPFIVIDMVVGNILLALGMDMLSPTTISMPFKLLLFVLVDGWYLIAKGLVIGYL